MRISKKLVTFQHPIILPDSSEEFPAGDYTIETEMLGSQGNDKAHTSNAVMVRRETHNGRVHTSYTDIELSDLERLIQQDAEKSAPSKTEKEPK